MTDAIMDKVIKIHHQSRSLSSVQFRVFDTISTAMGGMIERLSKDYQSFNVRYKIYRDG